MSHAIRSAAALSRSGAPVNSTDNHPPVSATVLDFICLFTHDLRRKQKRWQDGRLRFHTFNKRYMVYDDRGTFVGDGHWQAEEEDFTEGLELELDRGAAIVQVSECTGSKEQDLSEILDKRAREVEKRRASAAARTPARPALQDAGMAIAATAAVGGGGGTPGTTRLHFQQMHRPLSELVQSPGPIGRAAISDQSPYEARRSALAAGGAAAGAEQQPQQQRHQQPRAAPPAKRRKVDISPPSKSGHAQSLFGAKLTLTTCSAPYATFRTKALRDRTNVPAEQQVVRSRDERDKDRDRDRDRDVVMVESSPPQPPESSSQASPVPKAKKIARAKSPLHEKNKRIRKDAPKDSHMTKILDNRAPVKDRTIRRQDDHENDDDNDDDDEDDEDQEVIMLERIPSPQTSARSSKPAAAPPRTISTAKSVPLATSRHINKDAPEDNTTDKELDTQASGNERQISRMPARDSTATKMSKNPDRNESKKSTKEPDREEDEPSAMACRKDNDRATTKPAEPKRDQASATSKHQDRTAVHRTAEEDDHRDILLPESMEKRTELRIKSRKRRGLLMLSEKNRQQSSEITSSHGCDDEGEPRGQSSLDAKQKNEANNSFEVSAEPTLPNKIGATRDISSEESDLPVGNRARGRLKNKKEKDKKGKRDDADTQMAHTEPRVTHSNGAIVSILSDDDSDGSVKEIRKSSRLRRAQHTHSDDESNFSTKEGRGARARSTSKLVPSDNDDDIDEPDQSSEDAPESFSAPSRPKRSTKRKDAKSQQSEPGPRISRMARKSVNCKEIFGLVVPDHDLVPAPMASATTRLGIKSDAAVPNAVIKPASEVFDENTRAPAVSDATTVGNGDTGGNPPGPDSSRTEADSGPKPRIKNPATRGKKAARKEDAAGQVPQCVVPFEPVVVKERANMATAPSKVTSKPQTGNTTTTSTNAPGFSKANGGAWSRHAEDLLGMTRPAGKTVRR